MDHVTAELWRATSTWSGGSDGGGGRANVPPTSLSAFPKNRHRFSLDLAPELGENSFLVPVLWHPWHSQSPYTAKQMITWFN